MRAFEKIGLVALFVAILQLPSGIPSSAEEPLVVYGNDFKPPKCYIDRAGKPQGILVDITAHVARDMGREVAFELMPWHQAYANAVDGKGAIIGLSMTKERLAIFDFSNALFDDEVVLVVLKGKEFPFEEMEDLRGKRLGVNSGSVYGEIFAYGEQAVLFHAVEAPGLVQLFKLLLTDRVDAVLISPGIAGVEASIASDSRLAAARDRFAILPRPFAIDANYLGIAKVLGRTDFVREFNQALREARASGVWEEIVRKHLRSTPGDSR